ncbi:MAG TPA: hypothetical protein VI588_04565 [Candidatus Gracilibacteria bacterium]|nr:hypothetical protein [Candidatus Gracilibacteria bacterium]
MATLDELYTQTISEHRDYLAKLQSAFNQHCDEITKIAKDKMKAVPETEVETRKKIFGEQKKELDEALANLKTEIDSSNAKTRKKLEEIHTQREAIKLKELEDMMNKV